MLGKVKYSKDYESIKKVNSQILSTEVASR